MGKPYLVTVGDYHEFRPLKEKLQKRDPTTKVKEIGFEPYGGGCQYVGLVYTQKMPPRAIIRAMVRKAYPGYPASAILTIK